MLLQITDVSLQRSWERANQNDIDLVLEYRKSQLPELYARSQELNGLGARTIVNGLLEYGWTSTEITSSPSPFLKLVRKYLDENLQIPASQDEASTIQLPRYIGRSSGSSGYQTAEDEHRSWSGPAAADQPPVTKTSATGCLPNSLEPDSTQETINPNVLMRDQHLIDFLNTSSCLPNSLETKTIGANSPGIINTLPSIGHPQYGTSAQFGIIA